MKPEIKSLLRTVGFYIAYGVTAFFATGAFPGGPCAPGLGGIMLLALVLVAVVGFFATAIFYWIGNKNLKWSIWFHLAIATVYIVLAFSL